jgi:hypothetical protein
VSNNYQKLAAARFPAATTVQGDGRFACGVLYGSVVRVVYLAMTEVQQRNIGLGIEHKIYADLYEHDFSGMKDLEDADERRKRRREERQQ